jgi:hypothetical protein
VTPDPDPLILTLLLDDATQPGSTTCAAGTSRPSATTSPRT